MSFGRRLALLFLLMVVLPMLAVTLLLLHLTGDSRAGKADAALATALRTAFRVYEQELDGAAAAARELSRDPRLAAAVRRNDRAALRQIAERAVDELGVSDVEITVGRGRPVTVGDARHIARVQLRLRAGAGGRPLALLRVGGVRAGAFAARVRSLTGADVLLLRGERELAATVALDRESRPEPDETKEIGVAGGTFRVRTAALRAAGEQIVILGKVEEAELLSLDSTVIVLLVLLLCVAIVLAVALARALTGLHDRVAEQAITDDLTGLANRRRMMGLLEREVRRSQRFGHQLTVMLIDLDDFKEVNDRHGHQEGDRILRQLAGVVDAETRDLDEAARYGGDELAVVLLETGATGGLQLAERLRSGVARHRFTLSTGEELRLTISIGSATFPEDARDLEGLIAVADRALYEAKSAGKDNIRLAGALHTSSL